MIFDNFWIQNKKIKQLEDRIEQLETQLSRMKVEFEIVKTDRAVAAVQESLSKLEQDNSCCDGAGCFATPNCPKKGVVM